MGNDIGLGLARSVVYVLQRVIVNNFSNTFSLFQLETKNTFLKNCWPHRLPHRILFLEKELCIKICILNFCKSVLKFKKLKFIYSEKAAKFCKIFTLFLTGTTQDKSKVKISQNFVAFSEYINYTSQAVDTHES